MDTVRIGRTIALLVWTFCCIIKQGYAQVTVAAVSTPTCGQNGTIRCTFTGTYNAGDSRSWSFDGTIIINSGLSTNAGKYIENTDNTVSGHFDLVVTPFESSDIGTYRCDYGFDFHSSSISCSAPTTTTASTTTTTVPPTTMNTTITSDTGSTLTESTISTIAPGKSADHVVILIAVVASVGGIILLGAAVTVIILCNKRNKKGDHRDETNSRNKQYPSNTDIHMGKYQRNGAT